MIPSPTSATPEAASTFEKRVEASQVGDQAEIAAEEKAAEFGRANNIPVQLWRDRHEKRIAQLRAALGSLSAGPGA
jgi:hypothetical protein